MTKAEQSRRARIDAILSSLGFSPEQAVSLRRISNTLQRWHEMECGTDNGCIERDEVTGKPFMSIERISGKRTQWPIADRETGALKRLKAIVNSCNSERLAKREALGRIAFYVQTDPRGAALYILRPGDIPEGKPADAFYSKGICVY